MNDVDIIKRFERIEKRLSLLVGVDDNTLPDELYLEIELPEADIGKLHFNRQFVKSLFELKDGIYYCKDILFHSARNSENDNSRDILTEYLESDEVQSAFLQAIEDTDFELTNQNMKIFIPEDEQGVKTYNGGIECYWLKRKNRTTSFVYIHSNGIVNYNGASNTFGVSPAFCIVKDNA